MTSLDSQVTKYLAKKPPLRDDYMENNVSEYKNEYVVNTPVNTSVNTPVNTSANAPVNAAVTTSGNT